MPHSPRLFVPATNVNAHRAAFKQLISDIHDADPVRYRLQGITWQDSNRTRCILSNERIAAYPEPLALFQLTADGLRLLVRENGDAIVLESNNFYWDNDQTLLRVDHKAPLPFLLSLTEEGITHTQVLRVMEKNTTAIQEFDVYATPPIFTPLVFSNVTPKAAKPIKTAAKSAEKKLIAWSESLPDPYTFNMQDDLHWEKEDAEDFLRCVRDVLAVCAPNTEVDVSVNDAPKKGLFKCTHVDTGKRIETPALDAALTFARLAYPDIKFSGVTYVYNDEHQNRKSGYNKSAPYIGSVDPQTRSAHEQLQIAAALKTFAAQKGLTSHPKLRPHKDALSFLL